MGCPNQLDIFWLTVRQLAEDILNFGVLDVAPFVAKHHFLVVGRLSENHRCLAQRVNLNELSVGVRQLLLHEVRETIGNVDKPHDNQPFLCLVTLIIQ